MRGLSTAEIAEEMIKEGYKFSEEEKKMIDDLKQNFDPGVSEKFTAFIKKYDTLYTGFYKKYANQISELNKSYPNATPSFPIAIKFLEDKGIVLTPQEKTMIEERFSLLSSEANLKNTEITNKYKSQISDFNSKHSIMINHILSKNVANERNENLTSVFGIQKGLATDIMIAQDECRFIVKQFMPLYDNQLKAIQKKITTPFISWYIEHCNNQTIDKNNKNKLKQVTTDKNKQLSFAHETPKGEAYEIFATIIKNYVGKVIYVDFWATWCGPCLNLIERIKPIKEEYHKKNVVFLYITNQTSPKETYDNMIPNIQGEHFRLTSDQWNYLSNKFGVSGIPHVMLIDKKGNVVNSHFISPDNYILKTELDRLLNNK